MSVLGRCYRMVLLTGGVVWLSLSTAFAAKVDTFYIDEFLRITESSPIWESPQFFQLLSNEVQLLANDGLLPHRYPLIEQDALLYQLKQHQAIPETIRFDVIHQYFRALTDLHYGPTLIAGVEPYLSYPEATRSISIDFNNILNFALSGMDDPAEAFALARPDYGPYQQLRATFEATERFGGLTEAQRLTVQINLERLRRLGHKVSEQMLLVDIAGAELMLFDGSPVPVLRQASQVGRTDRQTPLMWSEITHLTVNPFWTVPPTVYREDMLPQIRQDLGFLQDNQIQVLDFDGRPLNPASINWRNPGRILLRQSPGDLNELGRLVVRFPNNEAIFLHDTPSQGYFSQNMRALSSGCIRLQEAPELAHQLLSVSQTDAADQLDHLLSTGRTQELFLEQRIPVLLAYWTVELDADKGLSFRSDIYGLDEPMKQFFRDLAALEGS